MKILRVGFKIKDIWDIITLSKLKDKWWYRIISFVLVIVKFFYYKKGDKNYDFFKF